VFDVLKAYGQDDVAVAMVTRDDLPSFGYMISQGATTAWENWQGSRYVQEGSGNHIMQCGGVGTFTYTGLAGIECVGPSECQLPPSPPPSLQHTHIRT
jgi:alpha-L-rhamnosidase